MYKFIRNYWREPFKSYTDMVLFFTVLALFSYLIIYMYTNWG